MNKEKSVKPSHWRIIAPIKGRIYLAMGISVLSVIFSLGAVCALAWMIHQSLLMQHIAWHWLFYTLMLTVAAYLSRGIAFRQSHLAAFALEPILCRDLADHLAKLPLGTIYQQGAAALSKVIVDDVRALHTFVADSTPLYARSYTSPVLTFLILLYIDWRLALVALGVLAIGMGILSYIMKDSVEISQQYNQAREQVNQAVVEFVQAMPVVRTFDSGKSSFGRYEQALDNYIHVLLAWYKRSGPASRFSMIILNPMPTLIALIWAGMYWFWHDTLSFSQWLAFLLIGTGMAESMMPYMALYHMIEQAKVSIYRIFEIQQLAPLPITHQPQQPQDASVTFEHVNFRYQGREENALTDISFSVPSGSLTALVGGSGAGKSTVARLIPRFWDVDSGVIKVGGVDVRDIDPTILMQQVAFVFQENFLFSGSIADNIRLGLPNATMEEIIAAATAAQAHEFISALPQGYETYVGERGASLSGGQRQRITIARAILQNRPILVLDEATAFADAENEALLMKALANLMQGKTVLMIAHRLSTIQNADQILMFEHGRLIETGTPQALLQQNGAYTKLWHAYQQAQHWQIHTA